MKLKFLLVFGLVGLFALTFALPVAAAKPGYALSEGDIPGWFIYDEGDLTDFAGAGYTGMDGWYQIWINNETWVNADKAMVIMLLDCGVDLGEYGGLAWDLVVTALADMGYIEVANTSLDGCVMWNDANVWIALGYKGSVMIMAGGYGSTTPPGGLLAPTKDASADSATGTDVMGLMTAQGTNWPGIPGFEFIPIVISIVVLLSIIALLKKDQLNLIKTY